MDVLCIGHAALDRIITVAEMPAEDSKTEANELSESGGGPAANAAYLLAKWHVSTGFAGVVGDDDAGRKVETEFRSVGTNTRSLELRTGHATPTSFVIVSRRYGTRTIITRKVPTEPLCLTGHTEEPPKILLFDGHEPEASHAAMQQYPEAITILDAGSLREGTRTLAEKVNYLVASERFAAQVKGLPSLRTREDYEDAVRELYLLNRQTVIITLGIRGLVHGTDKECLHVPAFSAITVDTTAAGDIFHGAFTYSVLKKKPLHDALEFASMAAALSVERPGGRASIPTLEEVQEALAHAG